MYFIRINSTQINYFEIWNDTWHNTWHITFILG